MAINDGIRVWRWSAGSGQWIYTNREHQRSYVPATPRGQPAPPGSAGLPVSAPVPAGLPPLPSLDFLGGLGAAEGDWCIEDFRDRRATRIPAARVPTTGTLWAWKGGKWSRIYKRSTAGYEVLPDYVAAIEGADGEVLIDTGNLAIGDNEPENPDLKVTILRRDGQIDEAELEYVAVPDVDEAYIEDGIDDWGIVALANPDSRRRDRQIEAVARAGGQLADQRDSLGRAVREYLELDPGDSRKKQLGMAIVKIIEEATPSPTPGTTAPIDTTTLVNDYVVGAGGIDDKGKPLTTNSSGMGSGAESGLKLGSELLAACGSAVNYARELKAMIQLEESGRDTTTGERQFQGTLNTSAANAASSGVKAVNALFAATDRIANLADQTATFSQSTSTVAQGMPFVGTALGIVTFLRSARKAHRARLRYSAYKRMLKRGEFTSDEMRHCVNYAIGKTFRKTRTMGATAATAVVGTTGSTLLGITAIVGGANAWNPVGWVLLGVAAVGGGGVVGYKIYKRATRKKRHERREVKYGGIKTPGDLAAKLLAIAAQANHADRACAELMLESFGVDTTELDRESARSSAEAAIRRHLR